MDRVVPLFGSGARSAASGSKRARHIMSISQLEELATLIEVQAEFDALNEQADAEQAVRKYAA